MPISTEYNMEGPLLFAEWEYSGPVGTYDYAFTVTSDDDGYSSSGVVNVPVGGSVSGSEDISVVEDLGFETGETQNVLVTVNFTNWGTGEVDQQQDTVEVTAPGDVSDIEVDCFDLSNTTPDPGDTVFASADIEYTGGASFPSVTFELSLLDGGTAVEVFEYTRTVADDVTLSFSFDTPNMDGSTLDVELQAVDIDV